MLQKNPLPTNKEKAIPSHYSSLQLTLIHKMTGAILSSILLESRKVGREARIMIMTSDMTTEKVKMLVTQN